MVKHHRLDVKGAPGRLRKARGKAPVSQAGDIFLLGFSSLGSNCLCCYRSGVGQAHLLVPRLQDLASYRSLIVRYWPVGHLLPSKSTRRHGPSQAQWWWTGLPQKTGPLLRTVYVRGTSYSRISLNTHSLIIHPMFVESILDTS